MYHEHEIMDGIKSLYAKSYKDSKFLCLSMLRKKHLTNQVPFALDGVDAVPSQGIQFLGVLIDKTLSFDGHISHLARNCYYQLHRIKATRHYILTAVTIQLMYLFVLS